MIMTQPVSQTPPSDWRDKALELARRALANMEDAKPDDMEKAVQRAILWGMQWMADSHELANVGERVDPELMEVGHMRSGRTTRMLAAALDASHAGRAVYVIGLNHAHAQLMQDTVTRMGAGGLEDEARHIKFESPASMPHFDLTTGRARGHHPRVQVFVDHATLSQRFAWPTWAAHEVIRWNKGK